MELMLAEILEFTPWQVLVFDHWSQALPASKTYYSSPITSWQSSDPFEIHYGLLPFYSVKHAYVYSLNLAISCSANTLSFDYRKEYVS
jgi:hypothetical protein